uniref:LAGLIDADG endonuclease n=1 Tax=Powellomyces hirtus TaxID=109895 RepID=A0A4P8NQ52_9FUNG|nr:LAGLIDADG endonuclease [Powellomyces hirtus]
MQFSFQHEWFVEWLLLTVFGYDGKNTTFCTGVINCYTSKDGYTHYHFGTRQLPVFTKLRLLFYNEDGIKVITKASLENFTAVSLAYLLMCDGYWSENTIYICTENFDLVSLKVLVGKLRELGIVCGYKKRGDGYRIRLSSRGSNIALVRKLVLPYFHSKMIYKLGL